MSARIVMNDGGGPVLGSNDTGTIGPTVTLSNFINTGVLGWRWELIDKPIGSAAVLSSSTDATTTFVPDVAGSYLVRLTTYLNASRTIIDAIDTQAYGVRLDAPYDWRIPAAGETTQFDPARGWATAREEMIRDVHAFMLAGGGGGASNLLWELDLSRGTDQFEASEAFTTGLVMSFTTQARADVPGGLVLRYAWSSGVLNGGSAVRLIKASELELPLRFRVEIDVYDLVRNGGFAFYGDVSSGSLYAYAIDVGNSLEYHRYDAGVFQRVFNNSHTLTGGSTTPAGRKGVADLTIDGDKAAATEPRFRLKAIGHAERSDAAIRTYTARHIQWPSRPVPAGWQTVNPTRAGITFSGPASGATSGGYIEIAAMRIYKHPADL